MFLRLASCRVENEMAAISSLDQFFDPSAGWLTPQVAATMINWKPDPRLRARIEELGLKANEGALTPSEQAEYEQYVHDEDLIALLQAKARQIVTQLGK
jgi:hypothetical protein